MTSHHACPVHDPTHAISARTAARECAARAGLDETDVYRVGIVATELATNLFKHGKDGTLLIRASGSSPAEVELIAIDRGPGIRDVAQALVDGHSTAGSPGTGLGAIRRMSDDFDISSTQGHGTAVLARLRAGRRAAGGAGAFRVGAVSVPVRGETVCGDAWHVRPYSDGVALLVADGLGHGLPANEASAAVVAAFDREPLGGETARALESSHLASRHTRGAAAAIADLTKGRDVVRFSGIGNVSGVVCLDGPPRQAVSNNGTLGHRVHAFREFQYPWRPDGLLVMHSDGVSSRWALDGYPGLRQRDPSLIAAILYRDFARSRDDATVVVAREAA